MFKKILSGISSIGQWETIYFTDKLEQFYEIQYKLRNNNVEFKTKITDNNIRGRNHRGSIGTTGYINNYYEVLVKKDDIYVANKIIHCR